MQIVKKSFKKLLDSKSLNTKTFNPLMKNFSTVNKEYSINRKNWDFYQGQIKASLNYANRAYLRTKFESTLVEESIVEVPALRRRRPEDTMMALKEKRQIGCYLISDHGDEVVDFVLEYSQIKGIAKMKDATLRKIHLYVEGREYTCTFARADTHPGMIIHDL